MPAHSVALVADLAANAARRATTLAFVPHEREIAVIDARTAPAVHRPAAAVIHLFEQVGDRTTFAARRQRLRSRESRHECPRYVQLVQGLTVLFSTYPQPAISIHIA